MPQTTVLLFRQEDGLVPLIKWLDKLETRDPRGYAKCLERILSLESLGNELRRPLADSLRDGIHELRVRAGTVQHRMLYFFSGRNEVVLSHGITKLGKIDANEIDKAVKHKKLVVLDKSTHTASWQDSEGGEGNG